MFLDLCRPRPLPSLLITTWIYCARISLTLFSPFFPLLLSICPSLSSSPIAQHQSLLSLSLVDALPLHSAIVCSPPVFLSVAVCASGTTASSHLKHFRETHICCFRTQRDMPWQRLFEVASQGEPEPERGI